MDRADVEQNRRGLLGPGQRQRLEEYVRSLGLSGATALTRFVEAYKADLHEGRVVALDGEVVFDARKIVEAAADPTIAGRGQRILAACINAYTARTNSTAPLGFAPGVTLGPGPYRLYVAPRSNLVVGGEPVSAPGSNDHARRLQHVLLAAQRVTEATLVENRRGRMTEAQRQTLAASPQSFMAFAFAILAIVSGGATYAFVTNALAQGKSPFRFEIVAAVGLTLVFVAMLPSAIAEQRKTGAGTKADAAEGRLVVHEGTVHKTHAMYRSSVRFALHLGEHEFEVTEMPELFAAVIEGNAYRIWVAPRSGRLVMLEIVEQTGTR